MATAQEEIATSVRISLARINRKDSWLAAQLEVSPSWLSRRMNGTVNFDTEDIDRVVRIFEYSDFVEWLSSIAMQTEAGVRASDEFAA